MRDLRAFITNLNLCGADGGKTTTAGRGRTKSAVLNSAENKQ